MRSHLCIKVVAFVFAAWILLNFNNPSSALCFRDVFECTAPPNSLWDCTSRRVFWRVQTLFRGYMEHQQGWAWLLPLKSLKSLHFIALGIPNWKATAAHLQGHGSRWAWQGWWALRARQSWSSPDAHGVGSEILPQDMEKTSGEGSWDGQWIGFKAKITGKPYISMGKCSKMPYISLYFYRKNHGFL